MFSRDKNYILRCEQIGYLWRSKPFIREVDGEVVAHVGLLDYPLLSNGHEYKTCALHAVCTKAYYRNQGIATALIDEAIEWAKQRYESIVLFTEIPLFYEKMGFRRIEEYRFHLSRLTSQGSDKSIRELATPKDDELLRRIFCNRMPLSQQAWIKDNGDIACFNALFATYPTYWSLYHCPAIDALLSFYIKDKTLHLFDVVAETIPSLDTILDHIPHLIEDIYFYFAPDNISKQATALPYIHDNGHLMVYGTWPIATPFIVAPLSRC